MRLPSLTSTVCVSFSFTVGLKSPGLRAVSFVATRLAWNSLKMRLGFTARLVRISWLSSTDFSASWPTPCASWVVCSCTLTRSARSTSTCCLASVRFWLMSCFSCSATLTATLRFSMRCRASAFARSARASSTRWRSASAFFSSSSRWSLASCSLDIEASCEVAV